MLAPLVAAVTGTTPKAMVPPRWLLSTIAQYQVWTARRNGTDASIVPEQVRDVYGRHLAYDGGLSRRALGMTYRPAAEVLADAYRWLLFIGALEPKAAARARTALGGAAVPEADWTAAVAA